MQHKNVGFEQLSDIMAFRVVVENVEQCYHALGVVHSHYPVVPGRFKDYISTPKPNNYRSLHTCVIGPERQRIELQIRTQEMHEVAELGVAAHWVYKQSASPRTDGRQYRWLRELLDILEHASDPQEFLEHTKLEMFQDQVFCFTPKGDLIELPRGSTPVDFAYAVHSEIGDTCVGAKVNGKLVPLRTQLANGDQVDIVTSKAQTPSPTWERFVVTGKARARIRRYVRTQQRQQYLDLGKAILQKAFRQEGHDLVGKKALGEVLTAFNCQTVDDLYVAVGEGLHTGREVVHALYPPKPDARTAKIVPLAPARGKKADNAVPIRGLIPGMALHYAGCCHPLPGDRIVGIVTTGKGVTIHTIDCEDAGDFCRRPPSAGSTSPGTRIPRSARMSGRIHVTLDNEPGSLGSLTTVIGKGGGNITNLKITNRSRDFFEILVDVEVQNLRHLTNVIAALRGDAGHQLGRARARG